MFFSGDIKDPFRLHATGLEMMRAYVVSHVRARGGQNEVIVTDAGHGPTKFSIRWKSSNLDYQRMRSELESTPLESLPVTPDKGTPCIAVKSQVIYSLL